MRAVIAGGGAAGFFAAIACARAAPGADVRILEKGAECLAKVRISGGGRCNVTHACFDPREMAARYPRGSKELIGPLRRFGPRETVAWFEERGARLKAEADGRMFPVTDSSSTVVDCLVREASSAGVRVTTRAGIRGARREQGGGFELLMDDGARIACDRLLLATGGCRTAAAGGLAVGLGHSLEPPVPSLFSFHASDVWVRELPGVSLADVCLSVPGTALRERGPMLFTHQGLSGPAILRLSAWGARALHGLGYRFPLHVGWLPQMDPDALRAAIQGVRRQHPARLVANAPVGGLPARLWERLALAAEVAPGTRWGSLTRAAAAALAATLSETRIQIAGKSLNRDEFVTCGGVRLAEVDLRRMESRLCPGLFFAGELLDIDGITGGFNFQAAWTTGWIAGHAMAG
ncbi:MAG: NAD(P)/FAD-dependent oxidoreductase [Verrucomicrobiae bacterium]|nr:NAD(P)/FAD-dependent oxidoreductase [Verrucomicrobiae bacterium]